MLMLALATMSAVLGTAVADYSPDEPGTVVRHHHTTPHTPPTPAPQPLPLGASSRRSRQPCCPAATPLLTSRAALARPLQAVITTFNWLEYVEKSRKDTWVLEFYAPWCKHCQALEPVYKEAAQNVRGLKFGKIDATEHSGIAKRWGVSGYPTIKFMRDGYVRPYNGMRNTDGFRELERLLSSPPVGSVETEQEIKMFQNMQPITFLLVSNQMLVDNTDGGQDMVSSTEGNAVAGKRFQRVAKRLQDIGGFAIVAPQVAGPAGLPVPPVKGAHVLRLERGEEPQIYTKAFGNDKVFLDEVAGSGGNIDGRLDAADLAVGHMTEWVLGHQFATVSDLKKDNFFDVSRGGRMVACAVIDPAKGFGKESRAWRETMLAIAKPGEDAALTEEERDLFFFGVMDGTEEDADTYLEAYGVLKGNLPQLIVFNFNAKDDEYYYFEGLSEHEDALGFIKGVADGSITAQYEGTYGMPDRIWRQLKVYAPFIKALDFLPRFTFTVTFALALVAFLVKCMCFDDDDDWLNGPPQPASEVAARRRKEREAEAALRKQLAATKAQGILSEAEKKAGEDNPAAEEGGEKKDD